MYAQGAVYMGFAALLAYHTVEHSKDVINKTFLYYPFFVELVLVSYEVVQMFVNQAEYFKEVLNWVDLIKSCLFLTYFIRYQLSYYNDSSLLAIILFVTLLRGITYFRLFSETRYYINLLYEVLFDVIPFLIILYYVTIGFAMIFLSLQRTEDNTYFDYLTNVYPSRLGEYSTDNFDKIDWLNYFLVSILISVIMLNLLVSILGDTFGRVNDQSSIADSQALASMIYEIELLFF